MYADENSLLFMETSAKTAMNVNDIFLAIGELAPLLDSGGGAWGLGWDVLYQGKAKDARYSLPCSILLLSPSLFLSRCS